MFKKLSIKNKVFGVIICFALLHLVLSFFLNVTDDEAYYWVWAQHLQLSYFDHPPLVAYLISFFTTFFGDNQVAIRLPSILILSWISYLMYRIYQLLFKNDKEAFRLVCLINIVPIYFIITGLMMLPDSSLLLCVVLSFYALLKVLLEEKTNYWYLMGIFMGLGLLSKYYMVFTYGALFLIFIIYKQYRHYFLTMKFFLSMILSWLIFSPVIYWNATHQWASFIFQFYSRQGHSGIKLFLTSQFLSGQLLVVTPVIFGALFWALWKGRKNHEIQLVFIYSFLYFFVFLLASLKTETKINWPICAYLFWCIAWIRWMPLGRIWRFWSYYFPAGLLMLTCAIAVYPMVPIANSDNVLMDMYGWQQVGKEIEQEYMTLNTSQKGEWFICASRYQVASKVELYMPSHPFVYSLNNGLDEYHFLESSDRLIGKNGLYICNSFYNEPPDKKYKAESFKLLKEINVKVAGVTRRVYYLYAIYNYQGCQ